MGPASESEAQIGTKAPGTDAGTGWVQANLLGWCILFDCPNQALTVSHT